MKTIISIFGILLIIFGLVALAYQGFTYTKHEKVLQLGDLQVSADTQEKVHIPPILGGAALVAGLVLVIAGRKK